MKKVFNYLAVAASAILVLSACTSDKLEAYSGQPDTNPESPDNTITFGTYTAQSGITRSGAYGAIDNAKLQTTGFGVFAYYTDESSYGTYQYSQSSNTAANPANFMFNQKVEWKNTSGYLSEWEYSPLKYWPNDFSTTDVDDQNNNSNNNPANGSTNGGKLSFFAYAPYVNNISDTDKGIVAINDKTTLTGGTEAANTIKGDPIITYKLAADGKNVDLLWGTYWDNHTSENVNSVPQNGITGANSWDATNQKWTEESPDYSEAYTANLLNGYKTNTDLTKQKTNGTVGFLFKHALSKIGGSQNPGSVGASGANGLMVVLDLDDMKGAEVGGNKDNSTIVTIESIKIEPAGELYDHDNDPSTDDITRYCSGAKFDLATGQWFDLTYSPTMVNKQVITSEKYSGTDGTATLATSIAEPTSFAFHTTSSASDGYFGNNTDNKGVTTNAKNVYKEETSPFVFIPGTIPSFVITVTYYVRTYDPNLPASANDDYNAISNPNSTWTKVKQTISKKVSFVNPVEMNKQYNLLMHLGLTGIKFTATVSDWELATGTNNADTNNDQTVDIYAEEVYLPINVSPFVFSITMNPAGVDINKEGGTRTITGHMTYYPEKNTTPVTDVIDATDITWTSDATWASVDNGVVTIAANTTPSSREAYITALYNGTAFEHANVTNISQQKHLVQAAYPVTSNTSEINLTSGTASTDNEVTFSTNAPIDLDTYNPIIVKKPGTSTSTSHEFPTSAITISKASDPADVGKIKISYNGTPIDADTYPVEITIGATTVTVNIVVAAATAP